MNNNLMIFENPDFGAVRSILIDGDPWFVAADVCKALEIEKTNRALSRLDDDEKGAHSVSTPGGRQRMSIISESGLYSLILGSRKPEARAFKRWITHEVIPSIRKHGAYMTDSLLDALEAHPEAVPEYLNRLRSENARNRELTRRLRLALPKAEYYDAFVDPADCTNIRTTAKELGVPEKQFKSRGSGLRGCGSAAPHPQARQIHLLRLQILFRRIQLRKLRPVCGEGHRGLREQHPAQGVPAGKGLGRAG